MMTPEHRKSIEALIEAIDACDGVDLLGSAATLRLRSAQALPALRAAVAPWQPISSAPKDGRWFLTRKRPTDFYPLIVVKWNTKISCFVDYNRPIDIRGYWGWLDIPHLPHSRPQPPQQED